MKVDIVTEGRLIDIVVEGFDAGIRLAETVPRDMIAVPIGRRSALRGRRIAGVFRSSIPRRARRPISRRTAASAAACPAACIYRWEFERHGEAMTLDVHGAADARRSPG